MQKIALITDSACDLDLNTLRENNINLLPLRIIYSNGDHTIYCIFYVINTIYSI